MVNMVFLLMKTISDCIARILIFSSWLYVTNDGRFSSGQTVLAYYSIFFMLFFFNIIFNKTDNYCSVKTWIGKYCLFVFQNISFLLHTSRNPIKLVQLYSLLQRL